MIDSSADAVPALISPATVSEHGFPEKGKMEKWDPEQFLH